MTAVIIKFKTDFTSKLESPSNEPGAIEVEEIVVINKKRPATESTSDDDDKDCEGVKENPIKRQKTDSDSTLAPSNTAEAESIVAAEEKNINTVEETS